jgi:hypothetical protein
VLGQEPRGQREGEVKPHDQPRIALGFFNEQLGDLIAGATALQPHEIPLHRLS